MELFPPFTVVQDFWSDSADQIMKQRNRNIFLQFEISGALHGE
jgi:hypothetical protein